MPDFSAMFGEEMGMGRRPSISGKQSGDWLRALAIALIFVAVLAFPAVYWIVTFTDYYEVALPVLAGSRSSPIPPSGAWADQG
jgi:hypothetical protein